MRALRTGSGDRRPATGARGPGAVPLPGESAFCTSRSTGVGEGPGRAARVAAEARTGRRARYTRPAMTHVFVAPHPDDVALSCGGLIAEPPGARPERHDPDRLLRRRSAAAGDGLSTYQREALGFGSKTMWPVTEAFNRAHIARRLPGLRRPGRAARLGRDRRPARGHPGRRGRRREAVLAALVVVPPGEHPRASRWPASRSWTTCSTQGAVADRRARRGRSGRRDRGAAPARGRGVRAASPRRRSYSSTCPTPSSAATRATTSSWARRATTTRRRSTSSAARSPGSSRRRSTCRSGSATTSTTSSAARSASGSSPRVAAG